MFKKYTITLKTNHKIEIDDLEEMILRLNFEKVDFVIKAGQYSIRGGILDVYSFADEYPFRLEFFDTEIESIRTFDINTQLSVSTEDKISIIPNTEAKKKFPSEWLSRNKITFYDDNYAALEDSDALILMTEWRMFRNPNIKKMKEKMKNLCIFDGRNQYDPEYMRRNGFEYKGIGR